MFGILESKPDAKNSSLSNGSSPSPKPDVKPSRRRDKPQLSCTTCRQKKLKCDRVKPCSNCIKRGLPESCDFTKQKSHPRPPNVHDRVQHLEEIVRSLLNNHSSLGAADSIASASPKTDDTTTPTPDGSFTESPPSPNQTSPQKQKASLGKFTRTSDQVKFVGSEHWESILEDITDLKMDLENTSATQRTEYRPRILFGMNKVSRTEILSSIPPRSVCDILISRFADTLHMAPLMIHLPSFIKEYDRMFLSPDETPLMWFGLFYSILGVASYFFEVSEESVPGMPVHFTTAQQVTSHFLDRTAQCLVETNYLRPCRYTLETFCFYYALETFHAKMSEFSSYVVLGIIIRVAMRLGYHRDANHYPSISIFDGEMRRRLWLMVFQLDLTVSAQVGLSRMIREGETDTAEPRNLLDTDLDEDMTELPQSRPYSDANAITYVIFKVRLLRQLGSIMDQLNSIKPPPYDEILRLDARLLETHATIPPALTMRPLNQSITETTDLILRGFALEVTFQKSRCMLHRKYLIPGKSNSRYKYSRIACIDAAMKILNVQITFDEATRPGGRFAGEQWRNAGSFHQDYILAATIICLDLARTKPPKSVEDAGTADEIESTWPINERLQVLEKSYAIWNKSSSQAALASKACKALKVMLNILNSGGDFTEAAPAAIALDPEFVHSLDQTHDIQTTSENQSPDGIDQGTQYFMDFMSVPADPAGFCTIPRDTDFDMDMNFDWGLYDSQFQVNPALDDYDIAGFQ